MSFKAVIWAADSTVAFLLGNVEKLPVHNVANLQRTHVGHSAERVY